MEKRYWNGERIKKPKKIRSTRKLSKRTNDALIIQIKANLENCFVKHDCQHEKEKVR